MATCKNDTFKCSLHISVLAQRKDIVKFLVKKFPETLHVGDNVSIKVCKHCHILTVKIPNYDYNVIFISVIVRVPTDPYLDIQNY